MKDQGTSSCPVFSDCSDCINQLWNIIVCSNQKSPCTAVRYRGIHCATGSCHFAEVPDLWQSGRTLWTSCSWFVLLIVTVQCRSQAGWQRDAFTPARQLMPLTVFTPPHFHGSMWFEEGSLPLVHTYEPVSTPAANTLTWTGITVAKINLYVISFTFVTPKLWGWVWAVTCSLPAASPTGHGAGAPAAPRGPLPIHWRERPSMGQLPSLTSQTAKQISAVSG